MKKEFLTNLFIPAILFIILLIPWNVNFANSECTGILHKAVCKNSLIITQKPIAEKSMQETIPGVFPFDDLIIKI